MDVKEYTQEEYINFLLSKKVNKEEAMHIAENVFNKKLKEEMSMKNREKTEIAQGIVELAKTKYTPEQITACRSQFYKVANLCEKPKKETKASKKKKE